MARYYRIILRSDDDDWDEDLYEDLIEDEEWDDDDIEELW